MSDLVERLKKRADKEREEADNNKAVAEGMKPQIEEFEGRGKWNTYAVRLGVDHRNCAKTCDGLANDWEEAAAALTKQAAEIARLREALESISNMHGSNPSDAMADIPEADYLRQYLFQVRQFAKEALNKEPTP